MEESFNHKFFLIVVFVTNLWSLQVLSVELFTVCEGVLYYIIGRLLVLHMKNLESNCWRPNWQSSQTNAIFKWVNV